MLLKDCPVGSVVRLVGIKGKLVNYPWWEGNFTVEKGGCGNFIIDNDGTPRKGVYNNPDYQFEIVAPAPAPEPRITFTVGGQEFYVGQRVRSIDADDEEHIKVGDEFVVSGSAGNEDAHRLAIRRHESASHIFALPKGISTTPPTQQTYEWKRGDWARHEKKGVGFVLRTRREYVVLSFSDETVGEFLPSEVTFISHSEPPK